LNWQAGTYEVTFLLFILTHPLNHFPILCRYRRNDIGDDDDVQVGLQLKVESKT